MARQNPPATLPRRIESLAIQIAGIELQDFQSFHFESHTAKYAEFFNFRWSFSHPNSLLLLEVVIASSL